MKVIIKRLLAIFMAIALLCVCLPEIQAEAAEKTYSSYDYFAHADSIKGVQGETSSDVYGGIRHTMGNLFLDDVIYAPGTGGNAYEYKGEMFYFSYDPLGSASGFVTAAKSQGMSVTVVFLMRYQESKTFLIDEASRTPGFPYYAPNTDTSTYGGLAMEAYWHYLMEYLVENDLHIDNFVLGNEVNMPNHWHHSGALDINSVVAKYSAAFNSMYSTVREYSEVPRCSVSLDHSWQHNDEGRGIAAKDFLDVFAAFMTTYGIEDWCVSTHLYPAVLYETDLWNGSTIVGYDLSPSHSGAQFVDGSNLWVMTTYIRDTYGSEHRVMLTEQGFTDYKGSAAQAACLAYTYYAAMYDPMVDCFLVVDNNHGDMLNFTLPGTTAGEVYTKIDNHNEEDQQWIADTCLPIIGVNSWADIVPNYGQPVDKWSINGDYVGNINSELISFDLKQTENGGYYLAGQIVVVEWVNGASTVPREAPTMTFKSIDGVEEIEVFVTPTGTNTYYFDRFIEGLTEGRQYVFEISSGSNRNISSYKSMNVSLATSPQMPATKNLGTIGTQNISYFQSDNGELRLIGRGDTYVGNINSELKKTELVRGANGNYVSGEIVVVEWVNGISTVPLKTPIMYFKSTDGLECLPVFVIPTGTNTYYFDRSLGDMDTSKEYVFTIESGDEENVSPYRAMIVTTAAMENKEGTLWESETQYVRYRTDPNTAELRIYAVNKQKSIEMLWVPDLYRCKGFGKEL